ncbi:MAG: hypothetical protein AUG51_01355 [Acidobacteria bacterium 13_1_20CM_3_53_8]|nr:MAG: hypothetical protein AUG51_01355 [Acidobacteria bacterium 13_1_20CM_3_53_8]
MVIAVQTFTKSNKRGRAVVIMLVPLIWPTRARNKTAKSMALKGKTAHAIFLTFALCLFPFALYNARAL